MEENKKETRVLAIDFGASSGRAMIGTYRDSKIQVEEIHRFSNDPVIVNGTMYWDALRLFYEIKQSLLKAKQTGGVDSVAVDTWGVDFGLIDSKGQLLGNPVHYRDGRTTGMLEKGCDLVGAERFYQITGNQFMEINTAFQLLALREKNKEMLEQAETMLLMPDLFNFFLSGRKAAEVSIASTTQLFDAKEKKWSKEIIKKLGVSESLLPEIVQCGSILGELSSQVCEELEIEPAKVIAAAGHDTQSAMAAVPALEKDFIFLSSGTWSLLGTELDRPIVNGRSFKLNLTNETGYGNKTSFLKNIIGLWMIQESRRQWMREGKEFGFSELEQMAKEGRPFCCFIDPDDPVFVPAGNIPKRIRQYCERTGQEIPQTEGEIVRCINESLAMKYRLAVEEMKQCTGKEYDTIYMVGGGTQSKLLCQMTASSCGCNVSAGPVEATVLGNVAIQLIALGKIKDIREAREVIRHSQEILLYKPQQTEEWEHAFKRFREVTKC